MSEPKRSDDMFEARYSIPRLMLPLAGTLGFGALALPMLIEAVEGRHSIMIAVLAPAFAIVATVAVVLLRRMADRRVQLRVDGKGVMIREWSTETIAHRSIRRIRDSGHFVCLFLHKRDKYPPTGLWRRLTLPRVGGAMHDAYGDIFIASFQYEGGRGALLDAMARLRPRTAFEEEVERRLRMTDGATR